MLQHYRLCLVCGWTVNACCFYITLVLKKAAIGCCVPVVRKQNYRSYRRRWGPCAAVWAPRSSCLKVRRIPRSQAAKVSQLQGRQRWKSEIPARRVRIKKNPLIKPDWWWKVPRRGFSFRVRLRLSPIHSNIDFFRMSGEDMSTRQSLNSKT